MRLPLSINRLPPWVKGASLGLAIMLLAATLGRDVARLMSAPITIPALVFTFFPTVVVSSFLLIGLFSLRFQGRLIPPLDIPRFSQRLVLVSAIALVGMGAIGLLVTTAITNWGLTLAVPILISYVALVVIFGLALFRVADAIAFYFAFWPILVFSRTTLLYDKIPETYQSLYMVPIETTTKFLGRYEVADPQTLFDNIALLSPELLFVLAIFLGVAIRRGSISFIGVVPHSISIAIAVLFTAGVASAALSEDPTLGLVRLVGELVAPIFMFYLVAATIKNERDLYRVFWGMLIGMFILAGYHDFGVAKAFSGGLLGFDATAFGNFTVWNPVVGNPITQGTFLLYLFPAAFAIMFRSNSPTSTKSIGAAGIFLSVVSMLFSASRGPSGWPAPR